MGSTARAGAQGSNSPTFNFVLYKKGDILTEVKMPKIRMPIRNVVKITAYTNAAWRQLVIVNVPELKVDTFGGVITQPPISKTGSGMGENNTLILNMDEFFSDNAAEKEMDIAIGHQPNNSGPFIMSRSRVETASQRLVLVKGEDGFDSDFNDTIVSIVFTPYFS